jgi:hypothetical protein
MRRALLLALFLVACSACAALFGPAEDPRLASWRQQASDLRGLAFEAPVRLEWISGSDVPDLIRGELEGVFTSESARRYRDGYAALGTFPPGLDLVETMMQLQSQSIAGMYSSRRQTLYVLDSLRDDASGANPGQSLIVVHELVHALQQQHAPELLELLTGLRRQDDVVGALSAVLEGDATFTMLGVRELQSGTGGRDEATAALVRQSMLAELTRAGGPLAAAPRLLRESLIFPYADGTPLSARRFTLEGTAGLDAALRDPPLSTLRVLAPEDTDPVEFVRLPEAELAQRLAARGCELGDDNVAGALTLRVLFDEYGDAAETDALLRGWSGDRFLQIDCAGTWELVWLTRWDSGEAAARFASAYRSIADSIAANAPLSGPPEVIVRERTALVVTPGLVAHAEWIIAASEIRAYASFVEWRRDDCFPESPCPPLR